MATRPQQVAVRNCNKCRLPSPLAGWVGTACQRLVWMRAADKTDGHHVDTLSTFIYKGPVEARQNEEAEAVESANALRPKNRVVVGSADRKVVARDGLIKFNRWNIWNGNWYKERTQTGLSIEERSLLTNCTVKVLKVKLTKEYTWCIVEIESRTINIESEK